MLSPQLNKNAVHKKLDELTSIWVQFTQKDHYRLFKFLVDDNNKDLIEAFISYHQEDDSGLADLFLRFENPFEIPKTYGSNLKKSLVELYQDEEFQELMTNGGVPPLWAPPPSKRGHSDYANFAFCCKSFYEYHQNDFENFVVILTPSTIYSAEEWVDWLYQLLGMTYPPRIRFIVLDDANAPMLNDLEKEMKNKTFTEYPEVNTMEIMENLAGEGNLEDPGVQFRQCFVGITKAAEEKNEVLVKEKTKEALQIVDANEWYPLKTTLYMALAGAYFGFGNQEEALSCYKQARVAASMSEQRGDVEGKQLIVHTTMAEASALIGLDDYATAAEIYDQNADLIDKQPMTEDKATNFRILIENYRMASYCHFVNKEHEKAWDRGLKALGIGTKMNEEDRHITTLNYAGSLLLEITKKKAFGKKRNEIHKQMIALLGEENWKQFLKNINSKNN